MLKSCMAGCFGSMRCLWLDVSTKYLQQFIVVHVVICIASSIFLNFVSFVAFHFIRSIYVILFSGHRLSAAFDLI
jgi:hypothetical protein